ncbi:hypothetical protein FP2506_07751 [Fulvimarina pelagi HTCC2506]|uniref:Uncharacterized protein n=1 Tax=Fulvimarina pelagi HTCC2506 TaxID=314231 RepID=Q0G6J6_9HYPH|nr:hypothetical protein [Fulvimarina pelagi]EAU42718.1 hypothetical protein FP2506_07751 [Fulvimarina pelagi HTCC2506]
MRERSTGEPTNEDARNGFSDASPFAPVRKAANRLRRWHPGFSYASFAVETKLVVRPMDRRHGSCSNYDEFDYEYYREIRNRRK